MRLPSVPKTSAPDTSLLALLPEILAKARLVARQALRDALAMRSVLGPLPVARDSFSAPHSPDDPLRFQSPPARACIDLQANTLVQGDNLPAMAALLGGPDGGPSWRGRVDLIYADPPFASQARYHARKPGDARAQPAFRDTWRSLADYLAMLAPRLVLMHDLLARSGSLYMHLDPSAGHYVKVLLDAIFGGGNFQREIVWRIGWVSGFKSAANNWIRNHDTIYHYVRHRPAQVFNKQYIPYPSEYRRRDGQRPSGPGYPIEDTWNCSPLDRMDSIQLMSFSQEKRGYDTQKNENLMARIISASSHPGQLVADLFGGSGTTAAVADRLGRRWISVDCGDAACRIARQRLTDQGAVYGEARVLTGTRPLQNCAACGCAVCPGPVRAGSPAPGCRCADAGSPAPGRNDWPCPAA